MFMPFFSFPYAQNIIFLPVVINSTYLHDKRVPVVLLVHYCLLLTDENIALHSYFYLLRMVNTGMRYSPHNASCRHDDTSVKNRNPPFLKNSTRERFNRVSKSFKMLAEALFSLLCLFVFLLITY